jgi:sigma-E factor negative regulatory protein RseC
VIEEQGRVVALEPGAVWVETIRHNACQSCAARKGCGHAMMDAERAGSRARVRVLSGELSDANAGESSATPLRLDEFVVIGIPEGLLLRGALMVYLMPLLLLFAGALLGQQFIDSALLDPAAVGGLTGLAGGFLINRWYSVRHRRDPAMHPQVLRRQAKDPLTCVQIRDPA